MEETNKIDLRALNEAPDLSDEKSRKNDGFIKEILSVYRYNTKIEEITAKILLLDMTYSTGLRFHFSAEFTIEDLARGIQAIPELDKMIENGSTEAVDRILAINDNVNLFSFASKYCFIHNVYCYGEDDYSIYDSAVAEYLPEYTDCIRAQLEKWRKERNYSAFNSYVGNYLNENAKGIKNPRYKLDRFLWNRKKASEK